MEQRIAIVGAGAVGSYIGGHLTRAGYNPTLIDIWGAHVDRMREHGLRVSGFPDDFTVPVNALHLTDVQEIHDPFDIVILSLKSYDTEWGAHFVKRLLAPSGYVVSAQNCMNDRLIGAIVGYQRVIPCVLCDYAVQLWEPGHVQRREEPADKERYSFRVGELHGSVTPRVEKLAEIMGSVDGSFATANIWGERWSKLALNIATNPLQALTGLGSQGLARDSRARLVYAQLAKECVQVGLALNYSIEKVHGFEPEMWANADQGDVYEELDAWMASRAGGPEWRSSMAQDVIKGRKTEIEQMNGYIVSKSREAGVSAPVNAATVHVIKEIEAGRLQPAPENVERVLSIAGL